VLLGGLYRTEISLVLKIFHCYGNQETGFGGPEKLTGCTNWASEQGGESQPMADFSVVNRPDKRKRQNDRGRKLTAFQQKIS
jgi:hypothetical protein